MTTTPPREGRFISQGLPLRYLEWGPADGPVLILLHGLRSYGHTWEPVALPLAGRWRVIALDQRGRGESAWDPDHNYYADAYVRDLEALVRQLDLRCFVLGGHSMGGANAFVYATRHPAQLLGLVIEDMGPGASAASGGAERIKRELLATPERFDSWDAAEAFWRGQRPGISEAALRSRLTHSLRQEADGRIRWKHDARGIAAARLGATPEQLVDLWPHVDAIGVPTLVLRGANSDFLSAATARQMAERNPLLTCVDIPGAGHYVHDDNLPAFNAALAPFLDGLLR